MVDMPQLGYRKYTQEQSEALFQLYEQMPLKEAAERLGLTYGQAFWQVQKAGIRKPLSQKIPLHPVTLTSEQLAYIAGLVDGEATVSIRIPPGKRNPIPHVRIANSSWPLMEWLRETLKGPSVVIERKNPRGRVGVTHYVFRWSGLGYLPLYEALLPYLVIKHPQMTCLVEFCKERLPQSKMDELTPRCREMVTTVRSLNIKPSVRYRAELSATSPSTT